MDDIQARLKQSVPSSRFPLHRTLLTIQLPPSRRREALAFVLDGRRKDREALGFIPEAGIRRHEAQGKIALLAFGNEPLGFAVLGGRKPVAKVEMLWVRNDARRIEHGRILLDFVEHVCAARGFECLRARVAEELEALRFWPAIGFLATAIGPGGARRGRMLVHFERSISATLRQSLEGATSSRAVAYGLPNRSTFLPASEQRVQTAQQQRLLTGADW